MSASDLFERELQRWLAAEAETMAPGGLHDAVIDRARGSRQRPHWLVAVRGGTLRGTLLLGGHKARASYLLIVLAVALAVVAAVIVVGALRADHLKLGRNGSIAYAVNDNSQRNQPYHVHLMGADGNGDHAIYPANCPMFSKEGEVLVYTTGSHSEAELNVAGPDGRPRQVVPGIGDSDYALSPDGTRVAWFKRLEPIASSDGNTTIGARDELWVTPTSGGPGVRVVPASDIPNEWSGSPVWSPDGRHIAFASSITTFDGANGAAYRSGIHIVGDDGADLRQLTTRSGPEQAGGISWSPDGRYLAYVGLPDSSPPPSLNAILLDGGVAGPFDIFVIGVDGTKDRDLTNTSFDELNPEWAPAGGHLAYLTTIQDLGRVTTVRMDGAAALGSPIIGPTSDGFTWSPDGTELLSVRELVTDLPAGNQDIESTILSLDVEFQQPPTTLVTLDSGILPCLPSWQRLEP